MTTTSATLKFIRLSPQKLRLVADQVRGLAVEKAVNLLQFSHKKGAFFVKKCLDSAIANAENNDGADIDNLYISAVEVQKGATVKRIRFRARGRVNRILKRSSHLILTVSEIGSGE